jgi:hypothetical protein
VIAVVNTVYLIVSAAGAVRVTRRWVVLKPDGVAFPVKIRFPAGWGRYTAQPIELVLPESVPTVAGVGEAVTPDA